MQPSPVMNYDANNSGDNEKDGPLAVLEEIRSVCLVKIVPNQMDPRNLSTRSRSSSLERTNISQVWNYMYASRHLARGTHAVGRVRKLC